MIIIKSLNLCLYQNIISFGHNNIQGSINLQIIATVDGSNIESIVGWWNTEKIEVMGSEILKDSPYKQKTLLLTLLNYIGTRSISTQFLEDPETDPIQKTVNAFVISVGYYLIIQKFYNLSEFNTHFENPFTQDTNLSLTQNLYLFKYIKSFKTIYIQLKIFKNIFTEEILEYPKKLEFIKSVITDLLKFYQWSNQEYFEIINQNKKEFWNFLHSNRIQKIENNIQFDLQTLSLLNSKIKNLKIIDNPGYKYYHQLEEFLIIDQKLIEAPINYPQTYQLELYDTLSSSLEYENNIRIRNIKKIYEPEISQITEAIDSLEGTQNKEIEDFQNKLAKKRIGLMSEIQKIELETNNEKVEIQKMVKMILKNFEVLQSLEFKGPKTIQGIKYKYQNYLQSLRNQLWMLHNVCKKKGIYGDQKLSILKFNNSLKSVIEIVECILHQKNVYFDELKELLESNLKIYQQNLKIPENIYIEYHKYLEIILKNLAKFKYSETIFAEYTFEKLTIFDVENLFIDKEQHSELLEITDRIININVNLDKLRSLEKIKNSETKDPERKVQLSEEKIKEIDIITPEINSINIIEDLKIEVSKTAEIIDLSPFELIESKKRITNEDLYQKILELTQIIIDLKTEIFKK